MKYLKIQNDGELDIRLVSLMGGTTKSNDEFKIGQWGSGLKYTLAYLLKNNIDFKIFIGETEIKVTTETEVIRDESFEIICIDGQRTSITTQMGGAAWEPWTIIRELWCNALDEGGEYKEITELISGDSGKTTFFIQLDKDFQKVISEWDKYFIHSQTPLFENEEFKIYRGGPSLRFYKQGVLILERQNTAGLFCYDIKNAEINELREFKGSAEYAIVRALANANSGVITTFIENVTDDVFEGKMSYDWYTHLGPIWKETIGNAKIIHQKALDDMRAREVNVDLSGIIVLPKNVYSFLSKEIPGISALRSADKVNEFYEIHSEKLSERLNEVFAILECCEYHIHPELKFIFGTFGDKNIQGQINLDTKEIYLSDSLLDKSLFNFVAVMIEENEHFKTGLQDCSRKFQQHWIDLYTKQLLEKSEIKL